MSSKPKRKRTPRAPGYLGSFRAYLSELRRIKRLSPEDEQATMYVLEFAQDAYRAALRGGVVGDEPAFVYRLQVLTQAREVILRCQDVLVRNCLPLVISRMKRRGLMKPADEAVQAGNLALLNAIRRYDPTLGVKFSTFAFPYVNHALSRVRGEQRIMPLDRPDTRLLSTLNRARYAFTQEHGRVPTLHELSLLTKVALAEVERVTVQAANSKSIMHLDSMTDAAGKSFADRYAPDPAPLPDERMADADMKARVDALLAGLPKREADILKFHFGIDEIDGALSIAQIAQRIGLGETRTRQLLKQALRKLANRPDAATLMSEVREDDAK